MTSWTFRFAAPSDLRPLRDLIERAYRGPETSGQWDSESHLLKGPRTSDAELSGYLADPDSRFVLAVSGDSIIGCALIQRRGTNACAPGYSTGGAAYFGMFATDPAIRAAGLGKAVLAEAERAVRDLWSAPAMLMTVISVREALITWYQRRGYALTGARVPFPFDDTTGETTRDFDLVEMKKAF
jgi:ribosomal protein S18 acetylase RimI-like enzyme